MLSEHSKRSSISHRRADLGRSFRSSAFAVLRNERFTSCTPPPHPLPPTPPQPPPPPPPPIAGPNERAISGARSTRVRRMRAHRLHAPMENAKPARRAIVRNRSG